MQKSCPVWVGQETTSRKHIIYGHLWAEIGKRIIICSLCCRGKIGTSETTAYGGGAKRGVPASTPYMAICGWESEKFQKPLSLWAAQDLEFRQVLPARYTVPIQNILKSHEASQSEANHTVVFRQSLGLLERASLFPRWISGVHSCMLCRIVCGSQNKIQASSQRSCGRE